MSVNPRYVAYARAVHGTDDLDAVLVADRKRYPAGCMTGFIVWINECAVAYRALRGLDRYTSISFDPGWDEFLASKGGAK